MLSRVTHIGFDSLDGDTMALLVSRAEKLIGQQGWSYEEFDRTELVYKTALYLYHVDKLLIKKRQFPCYVVHNADDDSRFESASREVVFRHYKRLAGHYRVAMYHWPSKDQQSKMYASPDYPFSKDHGPREE